jgi:hypothetical protein
VPWEDLTQAHERGEKARAVPFIGHVSLDHRIPRPRIAPGPRIACCPGSVSLFGFRTVSSTDNMTQAASTAELCGTTNVRKQTGSVARVMFGCLRTRTIATHWDDSTHDSILLDI